MNEDGQPVPMDEEPARELTPLEQAQVEIARLGEQLALSDAHNEALRVRMGEAEQLLGAALGLFRSYQAHHLAKMNMEKATRNGDMANAIDRFLLTRHGIQPSLDEPTTAAEATP